MRTGRLAGWLLLSMSAFLSISAQPLLDRLDDGLHYESGSGWFRADVSGLLDLETYYADEPPAALVFPDDRFFFNPRLSLFLDANLGEHIYIFAQGRADRGFDPGAVPKGDLRADEYLVRYTPFEKPVLNVQAGKFATVFGNWVARHDSWSNPFITAPMVYENMTIVGDHVAVPSRTAFLNRRNIPENKAAWLPIIWGPSYASGVAAFGAVDRFDYAIELKNAGLSSRPYAWDPTLMSWQYPTVTARLGFRPDAAWNFGFSGSGGAYFLPPAEQSAGFPLSSALGNYRQLTLGHDISYAHRHWQVWGEVIASRFETPEVGDADSVSYYLEVKRKLTARWFVAARWNQQFFDDVPNAAGVPTPWDDDVWRADAGLGYRHNRHLQAKLQYSYAHERGPIQQGEQLVAAQLTIKF